jgi:D-arginine dehydrogenase
MVFDFIVVGAGVSGASVADALAAYGSVALLEAETTPGYHSTGRSAALYTPHYGGPVVRKVNTLSRHFFLAPPDGFCDAPLLARRGALALAGPGREAALEPALAFSNEVDPVLAVTPAEALEYAPYMRPERIAAAAYEPGVCDIDVAALHQGYLRRFRKRGGRLMTSFRVDSIHRSEGIWTVRSGQESVAAPIVVNAAGAWADQIGQLAGARKIGLVAKRRSAIMVDLPLPDTNGAGILPVADFVGIEPYIKPEKGRLMVSPGDQTPVPPQDIQPDDFEIAVLVDWLGKETTIQIRRIAHSWAGLRSFVADQAPVAGFDPQTPGFFWLAGQGGFGIMMAPALAQLSASLMTGDRFPTEFIEAGLTRQDLAPDRIQP